MAAVTWEETLAERREQGEIQGAQKAVLLSAERRFSSVPDGFEEKIRAIDDLDRIYAILERVLEADSPADLDLS